MLLGTEVRIVPKSEQRGRIEIEYYSPEDLDRIYELIAGDSKSSRNGAGGWTRTSDLGIMRPSL